MAFEENVGDLVVASGEVVQQAGEVIGETVQQTGEVVAGVMRRDMTDILIAGGIFAGVAYATYRAGSWLLDEFNSPKKDSEDVSALKELVEMIKKQEAATQDNQAAAAQAQQTPQAAATVASAPQAAAPIVPPPVVDPASQAQPTV